MMGLRPDRLHFYAATCHALDADESHSSHSELVVTQIPDVVGETR